jgi:hypothetical protein
MLRFSNSLLVLYRRGGNVAFNWIGPIMKTLEVVSTILPGTYVLISLDFLSDWLSIRSAYISGLTWKNKSSKTRPAISLFQPCSHSQPKVLQMLHRRWHARSTCLMSKDLPTEEKILLKITSMPSSIVSIIYYFLDALAQGEDCRGKVLQEFTP